MCLFTDVYRQLPLRQQGPQQKPWLLHNDCNAKWIISRNIHIMFQPLREVGIPYPCYGGFVFSGRSRSMQQQGKQEQPPIKVPVKVICLHPSGTVAGIIQQIYINTMGLLSDIHVPRCMAGSLTGGFLEVGGGKMLPAFPAHAQPQFYVSGKRPTAVNALDASPYSSDGIVLTT